ncbi:MAG TPA: wax ester/triacylglycerol synthase family O-acyltransferase [Caldilineae bacterium]|nr:wax ester/triacylglycerol synthase family O-acyltransferase [Caldilineae bacterium]
MSRESLSNIDAAWLHMEEPTNLMMINGFFQFDGAVDFERVQLTLQHRLVERFVRFKQRVAESRLPLRQPYWEIDPTFDIDAHLHRIALPAPGDDTALRELISDLASTPLDFSKPLWQFHVIEGYVGGGDLLFCRLHHSIADGIALMQVLLSMCDADADAPWPEPAARKGGGLGSLFRPVIGAAKTTGKVAGTVADGAKLFLHPIETAGKAKGAASFSANFATRLGRLTLLPSDPKTVYKGKLGVTKVAAWSEPVPLAEVKRVGQAMGGTLNDTLMAAISGALRRYMIGRGESPDGLDIRAMVPVNLRSPEEALKKLGNQFALVLMALPIGIEDPLERFLVVKSRMDELKDSTEPVVVYVVLQAMGVAPAEIEKFGVDFYAAKTSLVLTNVPGPREKLYFAGKKIEKLMFWVPQSGRMGLGVSIISYAGEVIVGVITDQGLVPDPETIVAHFHEDFEEMKALVEEIEEQTYKGPVPVMEETERGRCKALTKAGTQCKNRALAGSAYCHVHARIVADSEDMARG